LSCPRCNAQKWAFESAQEPESGKRCRLFNPRQDSWQEHFSWSADLRILGKTGVGRATADRLRMNAPDILATRRLLFELGIDVA